MAEENNVNERMSISGLAKAVGTSAVIGAAVGAAFYCLGPEACEYKEVLSAMSGGITSLGCLHMRYMEPSDFGCF